MKFEWVLCPICRNKTRLKIREDTILTIILFFVPSVSAKHLLVQKK